MNLFKPSNPRDGSPGALFARAESLFRAGRVDEADELCRALLEIQQAHTDALHLRGVIALLLRKHDEAADLIMEAIGRDAKPAYYVSLGNVHLANNRLEAAVECFRLATEMQPDQADAYNSLGNAQRALKRYHEAVGSFVKALELNPQDGKTYDNLASTMMALDELPAALEAWQRASQLDSVNLASRSSRLSALLCSADTTAQQYLDDAVAFGASIATNAHPFKSWLVGTEARTARPLRVGIVLGDLRHPSVGYFLENVVRNIDPRRVALSAYVSLAARDEATERLKPYFLEWQSIGGIGDFTVAQQIRQDRIDVLIDSTGHAPHNRLPLFAWKPAPIQVTWPASVASTGLESIDYILGDHKVLPESEETYSVEKPWRMPDSFLCFTPPQAAGDVQPLPMLTAGRVTFGYFGRLAKVTDVVVATWAEILRMLPTSRLLMRSANLEIEHVRERTIERFTSHGVSAEQLILEEPGSRAANFGAYNRVDVVLSSFPYSARRAAVEGLWMGVPALCMRGDSFVSRVCESIVSAAGLGEAWVAHDAADYVRRAIALTANVGELSSLRAGLRNRLLESPLCDAPRFARSIEQVLHGMWDEYVAHRLMIRLKA